MYKHLISVGFLLLIIVLVITFLENKIAREYFQSSLDDAQKLDMLETEMQYLRREYETVMSTYTHLKTQMIDINISVSEKLEETLKIEEDALYKLHDITSQIQALKEKVNTIESLNSKSYDNILRLFKTYVFEGREPPLVEEES